MGNKSNKQLGQEKMSEQMRKEMEEMKKDQHEGAVWSAMIGLRTSVRNVMHFSEQLKKGERVLISEGVVTAVRPFSYIKGELESAYFSIFAPRNGQVAELRRLGVSDSDIFDQFRLVLEGAWLDLPSEIMASSKANALDLSELCRRFGPKLPEEEKVPVMAEAPAQEEAGE